MILIQCIWTSVEGRRARGLANITNITNMKLQEGERERELGKAWLVIPAPSPSTDWAILGILIFVLLLVVEFVICQRLCILTSDLEWNSVEGRSRTGGLERRSRTGGLERRRPGERCLGESGRELASWRGGGAGRD